MKETGCPNRIDVMARYTLYRSDSAQSADLTELLRAAGARVIASKPGLMLIEATDAIADQLRQVLYGWKITRETTARIPRPRPKLPPRGTS